MRIYIISPANIATGGTELLHQYSRCLTELGVENYLVYPNRDEVRCPTPETFLKYDVKYVTRYVDSEDSILVLPETQIHLVDMCQRGIALVWWLSVDNYFGSYERLDVQDGVDIFNLKKRANVFHFVQSFYAKDFVENKLGIDRSYFLKDYINDQILEIAGQSDGIYERQDVVLYNPKKGYDVLEPIIEASKSEISWVPLIGLKPNEMAQVMCTAKLYVDFGEHPGKDRIPREAAVCGCLVITNKKGSAAYQKDVDIPEYAKLRNTDNVTEVVKLVKEMLMDYQNRYVDYAQYRSQIREEKAEFLKEVKESVEIMQKEVLLKKLPEVNIFECAQPLVSVRRILQKMDSMMTDGINACYEGDRERLKTYMFETDYILQLLRETIYAELFNLK